MLPMMRESAGCGVGVLEAGEGRREEALFPPAFGDLDDWGD